MGVPNLTRSHGPSTRDRLLEMIRSAGPRGLDGAQIRARMGGRISPRQVGIVLNQLQTEGLLVSGPGPGRSSIWRLPDGAR